MRKLAIAAVISAAAAILPMTSNIPASAANAGPNTDAGHHICLVNHRRTCLDIKNDKVKIGQPVIVHGASGASGLGWNPVPGAFPLGVCDGEARCGAKYWPFKKRALDKLYYKDMDYLFTPWINGMTHLGLGQTRNNVKIVDINGSDDGFNDEALWIRSGNRYINVACTNVMGKVCVLLATDVANGSAVVTQPESKTSGWTSWYITGRVH
jgi:hypothetical protein